MGDHSHINNGTHQLPHIWPFIFTPYITPKPLFLQKIVTQSPIFFTLSRILEIFHSKTPNPLEFEKKVPKCSQFYMVFVTERPPKHGLFRGGQKRLPKWFKFSAKFPIGLHVILQIQIRKFENDCYIMWKIILTENPLRCTPLEIMLNGFCL